MTIRAFRKPLKPLTPPFRLGLVLIFILQFLVVTPAAAFRATDASTPTSTGTATTPETGTATPLLPTGSAEPTATPTLTLTPLASTAVPAPTETLLRVPVGEVDWLSTPASPAALASNQPFVFLAGSLINAGVVDVSACTSGALLSNGAATACGLEKARYQIYLWQNQFDPAIYQASQASSVPAYLLKNVFARESQFWPATIQNQVWDFGEFGLGQLNEKGADTLLMWNGAYFDELCQATFNQQTCWRGYVNLTPNQQALLRGLALSQVRVDCPSCAYRLDLVRTEASVKVFAQTLVANRNQVLQVLRNLTGTNSIGATSYADLWKFTLVNYHSGPGCLNAALGKTRAAGEKIQWKFVRKHFDLTCQEAVDYVEVITYVAPLGDIPQAPEPTPTAIPTATLTPNPEPTLAATLEPTPTTTPDLTLSPAETQESATPAAETALPTETSSLPPQEATPSAEVTATETATPLPSVEGTATATVQAEPTATPASTPEVVPGEFVADEIIVKFKGFPASLFAGAVLNGVSAETLSEVDSLGTLLVKVPAGQLTETLTELRSNLLVSYAEPNYTARAFFTPNDPGFIDQGYLETMEVPAAWEVTQGEGVVVAVIDTGVDASHPDLAGSLWVNPGETGTDANGNDKRSNGLDDDGDGYVDDWQGWNTVGANGNIQDDQGHGTHLAGIIAARMDNSQGFAGIAPQAQIMALKALDANGFGTYAQVAEAITYAANHGARIINLGFGGESPSSLLQAAIDYAEQQGVLVIASSGNSGDDRLIYPAAYPNVISVGAVDQNLSRAPFSTFGENLDLVAPGVGIQASLPGNTYGALSGTSMSAAQVSGVAALVASQPQFGTAASLREALVASALDLGAPGWDAETGDGLPRALTALNFIQNGTPTPSNTPQPASASPTPGTGVVMQAVTARVYQPFAPDTTTNLGADGTANTNSGQFATAPTVRDTLVSSGYSTTASSYRPTTGMTNGTPVTLMKLYGPVYATNPVDLSAISLSCAIRGYNATDRWTFHLYDYDPLGAAGNKTLVATSQTITSGTGGTVTVTPTYTINNARIQQNHRLLMEIVYTPGGTTYTPRIYLDGTTAGTSCRLSVTETDVVASPVLGSPAGTSLTDTSATLGATITGMGASNITEYGTVWNTLANPTTANNKQLVGSNNPTLPYIITSPRTGLPQSTQIYYGGYATNGQGTGYAYGSFYTEPTTQASGVTLTGVGTTSLTINWTRGSGTGVIVLMKAASAVNSDPLDGTYTGYTANAAFGSGTQLGTGNYVVYKGTGTSVSVTGLTAGTTYYVAVYEYAGVVDTTGVDQGTNYKLIPATVSATTNPAIGTSTAWTRTTGAAGPYTITNAAFSCGAGANRLLVAVVTGEVGTAAAANVTASKGAGVNFTTAIATASASRQVWIGYLTETQINGNTNSISITNNSGQAWTGSDVYLGCYNNVDQNQPLVTGGTWSAASNTAAATSAMSIPVVDGGVIVYGAALNTSAANSVTETAVNPAAPAWTERFDVAGTGYASLLAEKFVTAATTPVTTTFNWASQAYANAAISLNPGAFSTTVPILTSPTATAITDLTATLGATISTQGGAAITERGTCWGTSPAPATNCAPEGGTTLGGFTQVRTGLPAGTLVYYRGYAINSFGTAVSPDGSFYTEPTTQASAVTFTTVSSTSLTVNWTRGSGSGVLVLMKAVTAVDANPVDGTYTTYTANPAFASGTQLGTGNYVIFKGAGTSVTVTGLTVGTTYSVAVYEYAGAVDTAGVNQGTNYKLTPATGSQLMTTPPLIQAPVVAISSPAAGASFVQGTTLTFIGSATIPTNADVSSGLVWKEGATVLGTGASFGLQTLGPGAHTITANYTDVYGRSAVASVTIAITASMANPHNAYLATTDKCAFCHRAHTDRSDRLIDYCPSPLTSDNFCLSCHKDPNSTLTPTCATANSPVSEKIVSTHSNKEWPGGSSSAVEAAFEVRCIQCHNPHGSSNLFDIRPDVRLQQSPAVVTSGPVVFTTLTGTAPSYTDSFDEVDPVENAANNADDLCVTCHINPSNTPGMTNHNGGLHLAGADYRGLDCTTCHPHSLDSSATTKDGFMTGCRACHNKPQDNGDNKPVGGRRQIVGATGGDFTRSSHHVNGADTVTDADCQICHEMSQHKAGTVRLRNVDTGTAYTLNYTTLRTTPTQADSDAYETFCISCHDSNGRAGDTTPFSDQKLVPAVSNLWSSISPVPARHNGTFTPFLGSCLDCHDSGHGSNKLKLLDPWNYTGDGTTIDPMQQEEKFCYSCHTTTPGRPVAAAFSTWTNSANSIFEHDVSKAHTGLEHGKEVFGTSFANRHVECGDCHEPHKDAYPNTATAPAIKLAQRGASGVEPVWPAVAGAPNSFNFLAQAANEYQVCFKCHSSYTTLPTYPSTGLGKLDTADSRDLAREFNPNAASFHPVTAAGKNTSINTWAVGSSCGGVTPCTVNSRVYCTDCHTNANGTTAGNNGPHGSPRLHILKGTADYITNDNGAAITHNAGEVCFLCHDYGTYVSGTNPVGTSRFTRHRTNTHNTYSCYDCHDSHGSDNLPNLVNFNTNHITFTNGRNSSNAFVRNATGGTCYVACHGQTHGGETYP